MRTPRASTLLVCVAVVAGWLNCVDGLSLKKIYSRAKLSSVKNSNNRKKYEKSAAFFEKRGAYDVDDDDEGETGGPRLYDIDQSPKYVGRKRQPRASTKNMHAQEHVDMVQEYTATLPARIVVSLSSSFVSVLISSFLSMMLFSRIWWGLVRVGVVLFFAFGLINNMLGDLSRSLGVFLLLLLKKSWVTSYIRKVLSLFSASINLSKRRPFPPSSNPWRYQRSSPLEPDFNMYRTLAVLLLLGSYLGRIISCFLPLVPTWIDVLLAGGGMVYVGTLGTPQGDLARYLGFGVVASLRLMRSVSEEVQLAHRAEVVADAVGSFASKINEEHGVLTRAKKITSTLINQITQAGSRMKAEMNAEQEAEEQDDDDEDY